MSKISGFSQGHPWHVEIMKCKEDDERRHRTYCKHYNAQTKQCTYYISQCYGASHCEYYQAQENKNTEKAYKTIKKKETNSELLQKKAVCKHYDISRIRVGTRVNHKKYGNGTIRFISKDFRSMDVIFSFGMQTFEVQKAFDYEVLKCIDFSLDEKKEEERYCLQTSYNRKAVMWWQEKRKVRGKKRRKGKKKLSK